MNEDLYNWKMYLHALIHRDLIDYESGEFENINWELKFYELLTEIDDNWDTIIREV